MIMVNSHRRNVMLCVRMWHRPFKRSLAVKMMELLRPTEHVALVLLIQMSEDAQNLELNC